MIRKEVLLPSLLFVRFVLLLQRRVTTCTSKAGSSGFYTTLYNFCETLSSKGIFLRSPFIQGSPTVQSFGVAYTLFLVIFTTAYNRVKLPLVQYILILLQKLTKKGPDSSSVKLRNSNTYIILYLMEKSSLIPSSQQPHSHIPLLCN